MRLCVYKDSLSVGRGADKAVKAFADALSVRGHNVSLVERGAFAAALDERWDAFIAVGSNEAVDLDRAGYFVRPDRAPVILQLHLAPRGFFKWKHPLRNHAIRRAFRKADVVQLLCSDYVDEFRRIAPSVKTKVIGNYTEIIPPPNSQLSTQNSQLKTILYPAATVNKVKNQKLLIEAFAKIANDFPGWKVRLLGKTETKYAKSCRTLVEKFRLADRIEFAGFTDDLAGEYAKASFVAFPSTLEGFPLAVLEAASFGLPVVAQKALPGVRDIVVDAETGLVSESGALEYSKALARLMSDDSLRRRLGTRAQERCAEEYSKERVMDKWESLLREVTAK